MRAAQSEASVWWSMRAQSRRRPCSSRWTERWWEDRRSVCLSVPPAPQGEAPWLHSSPPRVWWVWSAPEWHKHTHAAYTHQYTHWNVANVAMWSDVHAESQFSCPNNDRQIAIFDNISFFILNLQIHQVHVVVYQTLNLNITVHWGPKVAFPHRYGSLMCRVATSGTAVENSNVAQKAFSPLSNIWIFFFFFLKKCWMETSNYKQGQLWV